MTSWPIPLNQLSKYKKPAHASQLPHICSFKKFAHYRRPEKEGTSRRNSAGKLDFNFEHKKRPANVAGPCLSLSKMYLPGTPLKAGRVK